MKTLGIAIAVAVFGVLLLATIVAAIASHMPSPFDDEDIHP